MVFPKAWIDNDHHGSKERFDILSPQIDDDDEDVDDHVITKEDSLQHSINLPPMSLTSPPPKYIASQVGLCHPVGTDCMNAGRLQIPAVWLLGFCLDCVLPGVVV